MAAVQYQDTAWLAAMQAACCPISRAAGRTHRIHFIQIEAIARPLSRQRRRQQQRRAQLPGWGSRPGRSTYILISRVAASLGTATKHTQHNNMMRMGKTPAPPSAPTHPTCTRAGRSAPGAVASGTKVSIAELRCTTWFRSTCAGASQNEGVVQTGWPVPACLLPAAPTHARHHREPRSSRDGAASRAR